jgi:hypothetical protein
MVCYFGIWLLAIVLVATAAPVMVVVVDIAI